MSSILNDVKHKIGPSEDFAYFDRDIIDAINLAFSTLTQLGVGPTEGFKIENASTEWDAFVSDTVMLGLVQSYVYIKVRIIFDPPNSSFVLSSLNEQAKELEYRLNVESNYKEASTDGN